MARQARIDRIVSAFVTSEYFATWQAERIESGSYSRNADRRDRFDRCYEAAEDGADGSTHREHIQDMREAFSDWLHDRKRQARNKFAEYPYRLETGAERHFDDLETWHLNNGTLDQEVG